MAKKTYKKPPAKINVGSMSGSYGFPKINVAAKPKASAPKKKVETKKQTTPSKPKVTGNSFLDVATGARSADYYSVKTKPAAPTKKVAPVQKPKATVKKVETKKVVTKKPEVKKPAPINKDLLNKMTRTGQAYYLDTKSGKLEKNPDVKTITKKVAEDAKKKQSKKVKSKIESLKRPETKKKVTKPEVVNNNLTTGPTVSQLWKEKTGTSWSEAKSLGLTDGSASSNIALMKKLKSGEISKSSLSKPKTETTPTSVTTTPTPSPTPKPTPYAGSGMGAMERADREFEEQGFRRGGSVKKMRKKIAARRKK